jgi:Cation transporter/ATPase, N-terminus
MLNWYEMAIDATIDDVQSSRQGLSAGEVRSRLAVYAPNVLAEGRRRSPWRMLGLLPRWNRILLLALTHVKTWGSEIYFVVSSGAKGL